VVEQRWGVVGIVVNNREAAAVRIQELLTAYGDSVMGRMGVPLRGKHVCVISLIVDGSSDQASELIERLAELPGVTVTSAFTTVQASADGRAFADLDIDEGRIITPTMM
jgi:putative iron-only hydrogenase system regulator